MSPRKISPRCSKRRIKPKRFERGQTIEGTIVAIGPEVAFVDVGGKGEATIEIDELKDDDGVLEVAVGDRIQAMVVSTAGGLTLSRKLARRRRDRAAARRRVPRRSSGRRQSRTRGEGRLRGAHRRASARSARSRRSTSSANDRSVRARRAVYAVPDHRVQGRRQEHSSSRGGRCSRKSSARAPSRSAARSSPAR